MTVIHWKFSRTTVFVISEEPYSQLKNHIRLV